MHVTRSVAEKARIKPGATFAAINPIDSVIGSLGLPPDAAFVDVADADHVLLFAGSRAELDAGMPAALDAMSPSAALWVFFRKGGSAAGLDMTRDDIWALAEKQNLRPLGLLSVDEVWSTFRLRRAQG